MRFRLFSPVAVLVAALGLPATSLGIAPPTQFVPTGAEQVYTVPSGVQLEGVEVQGAWGGSTNPQPGGSPIAQQGATLQGYLATTPGQALYAEVGQNGAAAGGPTFGGGGAAGAPPPTVPMCGGLPCSGSVAGSGGGASDVRTCSELAPSCPGGGTSPGSRLIVAGGGGGYGGSGYSPGPSPCRDAEAGAIAQNNQLPSPNSSGPAAIDTGAGIVIPGYAGGDDASVMTINGLTDAGMGTAAPGSAGVNAGCTVGNPARTYAGGVAGNAAVGPDGGGGGNASALSPCCSSGWVFDAGAGGGGGGGYFGGGGGATGTSTCSPSCGAAGGGGGGAAGSSFVSNAIEYPEFTSAEGVGDVFIAFVPAIEIDTPANGAVYTPGQVVNASWGCGYDATFALGSSNCTGTVPSGSPINSTPGTHTFTVQGTVNVAGSHPVSATVTYTVGSGGGGGTAGSGGSEVNVVRKEFAGRDFELTSPGATVPKGHELRVTLAETGDGETYRVVTISYYIGRGEKHRERIVVHGKHRTITIYRANLVTSRPGSHSLSTSGLTAGAHELRVVIVLHAVRRGHRPTTKTLTLTVPFAVA